MYRDYWKLIILHIDHFESKIVDERNCLTKEDAIKKYQWFLQNIDYKQTKDSLKSVLIHI